MQVKKYELDWGGRKLEIEFGKLARLANASCTVRYGDTVVLATAVMGKEPKTGKNFMPLIVDYRENLYAAGKISGSRWVKREGRPTDEAILTSRLIDRAIRPFLNEDIRNEMQIVVSVLSVDKVNDPDVPGIIASFCALAVSDIPFTAKLGAAKVGISEDGFILNPTYDQIGADKFEILSVSNELGEVVMLEAGLEQVDEKKVMEAIKFAVESSKPVIDLIDKIVADFKPQKREDVLVGISNLREEWLPKIKEKTEKAFEKYIKETTREGRADALDDLKKELVEEFSVDAELKEKEVFFIENAIEKQLSILAEKLVLEKGERVDGRKFDEIRLIECQVGLLPRTHGSGLFNRGETQVLSTVTLASPGAEQYLDTMEISGKKRFMHHYNFPAFSTGEVAPFRGAGRREIGHGALAEKALLPVIPNKEEFPYTVRVVSDVLSSNGSSSQASICGSILALMDAGVPIKNPVAGIAMGLIIDKEKKNYKILTDIQGIEDHHGCMDFKVAGSKDGITAMQMDIKTDGVTLNIVEEILKESKKAREEILGHILGCIPAYRGELSPFAPRVVVLKINPDKIRDLIGPGGKIINEIIDATGSAIDIEQDGTVFVTAENGEGLDKTLEMVRNITKEAKEGEVYEGKVVQIVTDRNSGGEIGAIVELWPNGADGMVHISQFKNERIDRISDFIKIGDNLKVKVMSIDKIKNRIGLSHKALLPGYVEDSDRRGGDRQQKRPGFFKKRFDRKEF